MMSLMSSLNCMRMMQMKNRRKILNYLMNCKMNMMKSWRYYNLKMN
jgi:hypothetical protein